MGVTAELQKLIIDTLKADSAVSAIVGTAIYDGPPADAPYPRITIGPSDGVPDDAECIDGQEIALQLDCWSRDGGKKHRCRTLVDTIRPALHDADLTLPGPYALNTIRIVQTRVFDDPDGLTAHGVVIVSALVEE